METHTLSPSPAIRVWTGTTLLTQFAALWATFFILSAAINWPASLSDPAEIALPRLLTNLPSIYAGYGFYLLAALLLVPAVALLNVRFGLHGATGQITLGLSILSAVFKAMGIGRWLFAMPGLATAWNAGADHSTVSLLFATLNDYAGGIGEVLGVGLLTGILTIILGVAVVGGGGIVNRLAGGFAVLAGAALLLNVPSRFGVELGPVLTLSNIGWQFAMLFLAVAALRRPSAR